MTKTEAENFFALYFRGKKNIPKTMKEWGTGWSVTVREELATWNWDQLTRLVVLAHDICVRVAISPAGTHIRIAIYPKPRGHGIDHHPELEWHIKQIRTRNKWTSLG